MIANKAVLRIAMIAGVLMMFGGLSITGFGQQQPNDPLAGNLFPPELVMRHQQALGLTEEQTSFIKAEIQKVQHYFTDLQFQITRDLERLADITSQEQIDEQHALTVLDRLLNTEREIKRGQISLLVRIKNKLTAEQQQKLREFKKRK
jgi:Spy/CpxP family protein refolding chaperone